MNINLFHFLFTMTTHERSENKYDVWKAQTMFANPTV